MAPPSAVPTLAMSAKGESKSLRRSSSSGMRHSGSPWRAAAAATSAHQASRSPKPPVKCRPRARVMAPVSVATSTMWVAPCRSAQVMRVAQDEATLRVGVGDLHALAVEGADDVTRARGVRSGHVLDGRRHRQHGDAGRQLGGRGDGVDDRGRAGLVGLHLVHVGRRLEADAAGVEGDALAHQGQEPTARIALLCRARSAGR